LQLIIAPRHVERASEVRSRLEELGLAVAMRSEPSGQLAECLVLNTTGELQSWYAVATIVFMGKSLTARGGQNPVEPILAGKPVLFGPHMENFSALASALIAHGGAIQVDGPGELQEKMAWLLRDRAAALDLVSKAHAVVARHRGATDRTAAIVMRLRSDH
jgi:3-deoxy-D-manno-octulosonic-acid transferase